MFLHTSCSYSPYVTLSTPALASFRRPSKAAINAAGVSRCASERNRVVLPALASSDNRLSSVDMVLDLGVSPRIPESGRPDVSPFPPVGTVAAPSQGPAVPHLRGYYGVVRLLRHPSTVTSGLPWWPVPPLRRWEALLGSWRIPLEACPELETPAAPYVLTLPAVRVQPSARITASASATIRFRS